MNEEKNPRGNTVLLTVIAVATLLVAVIGATFAYFTVSITGNDSATSVIVKTATLGIVYTSGDVLSLENLMPGDPRLATETKEFIVRNDSTVDMEYSVMWSNVTNTFAAGHDLSYSVVGTVTAGTGTTGSVPAGTSVPSGDGAMMSSITILAGAEHTYVLTLAFPNTSSSQDAQQGKTFMGKISITSPMVGP